MLTRLRWRGVLPVNARPRRSPFSEDYFRHCSRDTADKKEDILFLTPHANRTGDTETIMGPLADPICLTGHIGAETTFRELVTRFSQQSMDAMDTAEPGDATGRYAGGTAISSAESNHVFINGHLCMACNGRISRLIRYQMFRP